VRWSLVTALLVACGGGGSTPADAPPGDAMPDASSAPTALVIDVGSAQLASGTDLQLAATAFGPTGVMDVTAQATWTTSDPGMATVDAGRVHGVAPGQVTISAQLGALTATAQITVTAAVLVSIAVTPPTSSVPAGLTQPLVATGTFSDMTTQDLTASASWTTSDATIASVAGGVVTGEKVGGATITAGMLGVSGSATVSVTAAQLVSIAVTPPGPSIAAGLDLQFTATGTFTDASQLDLTSQVTWSSDASAATISAAGLAHGAAAGDATITAKLGAISGSTTLHVTGAQLVSIAVTGVSSSVAKGFTDQLTATGTYSDTSTADLTTQVAWSTDPTGIATVSNASGSQGLATGVDVGSTTVTAQLGAVAGTFDLSVTPAVLVSIAVTVPMPSLAAGTTEQLIATGTFSDNSTADLTQQVTWSDDAPTVAQVANARGAHGKAFALAAGTTTVSATSGSVAGTAPLTVTAATLTSIAIAPGASSLPQGFTRQLTATGTYSDLTTADLSTQVTWGTSDMTIATIDASGVATPGASTGPVGVTAQLGGVMASAQLTVTTAALQAIAVTPASPTTAVGAGLAMAATGTFDDASQLDLTTQVTWGTGDPTVATVTAGGIATGVNAGSTTITAQAGGIEGMQLLTVPDTAFELTLSGVPGDVSVYEALGELVATCTASCTVAVPAGAYTIVASTPSQLGPFTGACAGNTETCTLNIGSGTVQVGVSFAAQPHELRSELILPGEQLVAAAFDSAGNLVVGSSAHVVKLDPVGNVLWTQPIAAQQIRIGPGDMIDVDSCANLVQLEPDDGSINWSVPLGSVATTCPTPIGPPFQHWMDVSATGDIVLAHGAPTRSETLASWSSTGTQRWQQSASGIFDTNSIAVDSQGQTWAAVEAPGMGEPLYYQGFASDGSELAGLLSAAGYTYDPMIAIDGFDHIVSTSSGHSEAYLDRIAESGTRDFFTRVNGLGSVQSDVGVAVLGTGELAWTYNVSDEPSPFGEPFVLTRVSALGVPSWTLTRPSQGDETYLLGVQREDIAGDLAGHIALVGGYIGSDMQIHGWITVFGP